MALSSDHLPKYLDQVVIDCVFITSHLVPYGKERIEILLRGSLSSLAHNDWNFHDLSVSQCQDATEIRRNEDDTQAKFILGMKSILYE